MKSGIYKITSPEGKTYIGQSVDLKRRKSEYKRLHCKDQPAVYDSLKKHGFDKHLFEIILLCDVCQLNEMERYYQIVYDATGDNSLNLSVMGYGDSPGWISDVVKNKISSSKKGRKRPKFSEEWIRNISKAHIGIKHPPRTKEALLKMSLAHRGKKQSKETIELRVSKTVKEVYKFSLKGCFIEKYPSIKTAAVKNNIPACSIVNCLSGRSSTCSGFMWSRNENILTAVKVNGRSVIGPNGEVYRTIKDAAVVIGIGYQTLYGKLSGANKNDTGFRFLSASNL